MVFDDGWISAEDHEAILIEFIARELSDETV